MKKILVIGGSYQGKTKWVQEHYPQYKKCFVEEMLKLNAAGKQENGIFVNQFHMQIKQWMKEKEDIQKNVALLLKNPSWIIVSDEVGSGIVPLEKEDRDWRETTGRILCDVAGEADEVYRIYCGIPTKIKGSDS